MKLNCDLGESFGSWKMGLDEHVMPVIEQANIACGFHGGDPLVITKTLQLAKQHRVTIGAHPSYPDLVGFGRRSMQCSQAELTSLLHYQISALAGMANIAGLTLKYVKPHGALYNDMMVNDEIRNTIMQAVASYAQSGHNQQNHSQTGLQPLALMLQATPNIEQHRSEAKKLGLTIWAEAFADRCYNDDGTLVSREHMGAVHNREKTLEQALQLSQKGSVTTLNGNTLMLSADTLCVHGDNPEAVQAIIEIKALLA